MNNRTTGEFVPAMAQSLRRKRRFLTVGVAGLAVLGVTMGVSFLDNSGTTSIAISATPSTIIWPLGGSTAPLPSGNGGTNPLRTTAFSGSGTTSGCSVSGATYCVPTVVSPFWPAIAGSAGAVTTAGDLAIVDATSATNYVTVSVYITNLAALLVDYSSFAFPINVYQTTCTSTACSLWTAAPAVSQTNFGSYLTDTQPQLTFSLPVASSTVVAAGGRYYYDIVMEGTNHYTNASSAILPTGAPATTLGSTTTGLGGAFSLTQTGGTNGSLSPTFFFTASTS